MKTTEKIKNDIEGEEERARERERERGVGRRKERVREKVVKIANRYRKNQYLFM